MGFELLLGALLAGGIWLVWIGRRRRRLAYIAGYRFHPAIKRKMQERHPHLSEAQVARVLDGLRD